MVHPLLEHYFVRNVNLGGDGHLLNIGMFSLHSHPCSRLRAPPPQPIFTYVGIAYWMDGDAMRRAEALDRHYADTGGGTVGPLHGVPCTVKDHFAVKGYPVYVSVHDCTSQRLFGVHVVRVVRVVVYRPRTMSHRDES